MEGKQFFDAVIEVIGQTPTDTDIFKITCGGPVPGIFRLYYSPPSRSSLPSFLIKASINDVNLYPRSHHVTLSIDDELPTEYSDLYTSVAFAQMSLDRYHPTVAQVIDVVTRKFRTDLAILEWSAGLSVESPSSSLEVLTPESSHSSRNWLSSDSDTLVEGRDSMADDDSEDEYRGYNPQDYLPRFEDYDYDDDTYPIGTPLLPPNNARQIENRFPMTAELIASILHRYLL